VEESEFEMTIVLGNGTQPPFTASEKIAVLAGVFSLQNKGRKLILAQFAHYGPQSGHSRANKNN
jgi:hypothetical protein